MSCFKAVCPCVMSEVGLITYSFILVFLSLNQVWETKKVCKNSAVVLKQEIDVVFQDNEVTVLAVDNMRRLQVSIFRK